MLWTVTILGALAVATPASQAPTAGEPALTEQEIQRLRAENKKLAQQIDELQRKLELLEVRSDEIARRLGIARPASRRGVRAAAEQEQRAVVDMIAKKGLLLDDLPTELRSHLGNAKKALAVGDSELAMNLLRELNDAVASIAVDRSFVEDKMRRLAQRQRAVAVDKRYQPEIAKRFEKVTKLYTDGRYELANSELNEVHALIDTSARDQQSAAERTQREEGLPPPPD